MQKMTCKLTTLILYNSEYKMILNGTIACNKGGNIIQSAKYDNVCPVYALNMSYAL